MINAEEQSGTGSPALQPTAACFAANLQKPA